MTLVEDKLYLEIHNFSFLKGYIQQTSSKSTSLPWITPDSSGSQISNAHHIHSERDTTKSTKRKSQNPFQPNKIAKLSDIAINALNINNNPNEESDNNEEFNKVNEIIDDKSTEADDTNKMVLYYGITCIIHILDN
jgi:hypothetical protein